MFLGHPPPPPPNTASLENRNHNMRTSWSTSVATRLGCRKWAEAWWTEFLGQGSRMWVFPACSGAPLPCQPLLAPSLSPLAFISTLRGRLATIFIVEETETEEL